MDPPPQDRVIVLFDGLCILCTGAVQFVLPREPAGCFQFASLQSKAARRLLGADRPAETLVLIESGTIYIKSTAVLRITRRLRFPWPLLYAFTAVPRPLRDLVYSWVARHRYRWFGKRDVCLMPSPEVRGRFLE